jgi:ATP-dependent DNA helicase RecG
MRTEGQDIEMKSLRLLTSKQPDWEGLAKDCVAFANAQGGCIQVGIEDGQTEPPAGQCI